MNAVLRLETIDREEAFKGNEGLSNEDWSFLAKEARTIYNMYEAMKKHKDEASIDL